MKDHTTYHSSRLNIFLRKRMVFSTPILIIAIIFFLSSCSSDANRIYKENSKAVVEIVIYDSKGNPISQGNGFIVRKDGVIVTNYHVITAAEDIKVKASGKVLEVERLLYINKENDIAILKAESKELPIVKLGDIDKAVVGENVYVISRLPGGLESTLSDGILQGVEKIDPKMKLFQITAPTSAGSSGAPVFNKHGEVIGVATCSSKRIRNLTYAVPINLIKDKISAKNITALKDAGLENYSLGLAEKFKKEGNQLSNAGRHWEAIEAFTKAIKLRPTFDVPYINRSYSYLKLEQFHNAIEDCNKAIELNTKYDWAYINRGVAYAELGKHKQALSNYKKALVLNPENGLTYYDISCTMAEQRNIAAACDYFKRAIDKGFNDWNLVKQDKEMDALRSQQCYRQIMRGK